MRRALLRILSPWLKKHPQIRRTLRRVEVNSDLVRHTVAAVLPQIIQPDPREIYITLTAHCNLRCLGCRYGRDFMPGSSLPWPVVRDLLEDCRQAGIRNIRLYGGEPLLHKDIVRIVEQTVALGLRPWLTTNAILLKEKIDDLYRAGLRTVSVGYYGKPTTPPAAWRARRACPTAKWRNMRASFARTWIPSAARTCRSSCLMTFSATPRLSTGMCSVFWMSARTNAPPFRSSMPIGALAARACSDSWSIHPIRYAR